MKKLMLPIALLGGAACGGDLEDRLAQLEERVAQLETKEPAAPKPAAIRIHDDDPFIGAKNAKVTLVEAFEYACPYCAMLDPIMDELMKKYEGQPVKLVEKQFVVHPNIATEPALAVCAAQRLGAYDRYADALWDKAWTQDGRWSLNQRALGREALLELAEELGFDRARFVAELDGVACKTKLQRDKNELSRAGVRATPTLFINGRLYQGARTVEALSAAIEEAKKG